MEILNHRVFVVLFSSLFYYAVCSEVQNCGGNFSGFQYTIKSPNYPQPYTENLNCIYTLTGYEVPKCQPTFYLQFLDFDIKTSKNCKDEYLRVGNHHIFCGNTKHLKKFEGTDGSLQLIFHTSEQRSNHRGFKILVTVDCGINYDVNSRRNRSDVVNVDNDISLKFLEGNVNSKPEINENPTNKISSKNDVTAYFFFPPTEKNITVQNSQLTTEKKPDKDLTLRNVDLKSPSIEPLAQVFNPNCDPALTNPDPNFDPRLKSGIFVSVNNPSQGPFNEYYPNPNIYNTYPNNYSPNDYSPNGFVPNNIIPINPPINPFPGFGGYPTIDGGNGFPSIGSECCRSIYSAPRFLLASPGFPNFGSSSNPFSCGYTVQKSSPQICNLRLNFKFFNFGSEDSYCNNGYLEVEGQRFCGCRTGLSVLSPFTADLKRINIRYFGIPQSKFSGFLIDVVQEGCNYNYNYNYNYRQKREAVVEDNNREKRQLGYSYQKPNKRFVDGHYNQNFYLRTSGRGNFGSSCQARVFFDWVLASKEAYLKNARCQSNSLYPRNNYLPFAKLVAMDKSNETRRNDFDNCEIINKREGMLSSPGYPAGYANNIHKCYRFQKIDGFCRIDISVFDFDLESSKNCDKDFVQFDRQRRYCDQTLIGKKLSLDVLKGDAVQMNFISDANGHGRGFSLAYEHVRC